MARRCFYVRIVLNEECNLRCTWCHREGMSIKTQKKLRKDELLFYIRVLKKAGFKKFKFLGGEPTLRKDFIDILSETCKISGIDVSMVTNGTDLLKNADLYKQAGINRINVTLDAITPEYFKKYIGNPALLPQILKGIDKVVELRIPIKINFVYLKGESDDELEKVIKFAKDRGIRVNLLNVLYYPQDEQRFGKYHAKIPELITLISKMGIKESYYKNDVFSLPTLIFKLKNGGMIELKHSEIGTLGLLNSCWSCKVRDICAEGIYAIRLTPDGLLKPCMLRDDNCFNLKEISERLDYDENKVTENIEKYMSDL